MARRTGRRRDVPELQLVVPLGQQEQLAVIRENGGYVIIMGDGTCHLPNGRHIKRSVISHLLAETYLLSQNDGLLNDCPQTLTINETMLSSATFAKPRHVALAGSIR
jgi:hypothetical protein